jgi:hypothetical protein
MPTVSPVGYRYIRELYARGQLKIEKAEVVVSGLRISASASILAINTVSAENYEDLIIDFSISFNASVGGTLQEIFIVVSGPTIGNATPLLHFCSKENMQIPQGNIRITKRFIVRWFTK